MDRAAHQCEHEDAAGGVSAATVAISAFEFLGRAPRHEIRPHESRRRRGVRRGYSVEMETSRRDAAAATRTVRGDGRDAERRGAASSFCVSHRRRRNATQCGDAAAILQAKKAARPSRARSGPWTGRAHAAAARRRRTRRGGTSRRYRGARSLVTVRREADLERNSARRGDLVARFFDLGRKVGR